MGVLKQVIDIKTVVNVVEVRGSVLRFEVTLHIIAPLLRGNFSVKPGKTFEDIVKRARTKGGRNLVNG